MSRVLYSERKVRWSEPDHTGRDYVTDYVEVHVRSWTCEGMTPDVVIQWVVMVDRALIYDERRAYSHGDADAKFIRMGIAKFDAWAASHPALSKGG